MEKVEIVSKAVGGSATERSRSGGIMFPIARTTKRFLDVVANIVGLIIFSPVLLAIYIAIKCGDHGKAIFNQERVGYHGKIFTLYKFRSMITLVEADGKPALCQKRDKRLTRVGRFLREYHLDELPQLWNVLRGEMSFIGPRPERGHFVDQVRSINPDYEQLYQLRPGLFSAATLYNGYTDSMTKMPERLWMDLDYPYHRSLWLGTKIILLTVFSILVGKKFWWLKFMTKIRLMKFQPNLQLRKIGNRYMIISTASGNVNMTDVFTLNETAARFWQLMEGKDITSKELAVLLCNGYEVGKEDALKDAKKQLRKREQPGLVG